MIKLTDSIKVKGLTLKNRIVMPPMHTGLADKEGKATKKLIDHYTKRSKSIGLLIVEHSYVSVNGKFSKNQLGIDNDGLIGDLEKLTSTIHSNETPLVLQINHAGRSSNIKITGKPPIAPSAKGEVLEIKRKEIKQLIEYFENAAERAIKAGFDGVEIHGAHIFLLTQFFNSLTNQRSDEYGGNLENRMRFPLEVVKAVRKKIGKRLLLYRLGVDDLDSDGKQIKECQEFAVRLQDDGIDILDISVGLGGGSQAAQKQETQGYFIHQANQIKKVLEIPVIGVGGIKDPEYANKLISDGMVDLVAVGRSLLKDSLWAKKAIKKLSEKRFKTSLNI